MYGGTTRTTDVTQDELFVSGSEFRFTSGPLAQAQVRPTL